MLLIDCRNNGSILDADNEGRIVDENQRLLCSLRRCPVDTIHDSVPLSLPELDVPALHPGLSVAADLQPVLQNQSEVRTVSNLRRLYRRRCRLADQKIVYSTVLNAIVHGLR